MPKGISQTAQTLAGCLWTSSSRESANSGRRLESLFNSVSFLQYKTRKELRSFPSSPMPILMISAI